MKKRHIIAMGGGGFSMEPDNLLLDEYVIECSGKSSPAVCFIPTASAESTQYVVNFYTAFNKLGCNAGFLSLFNQPQRDLEAWLRQFDIIYVGGGNTRCMLALWREWNLDNILRKLWEDGVIMSGISAGAICWFEQGITDSVPGELTSMDCLGFVQGSCCPHYDGELQRRPTYQNLVGKGSAKSGIALDDGVAIHYVDEQPYEIVSSRPDASAYRLEKIDGSASEQVVKPRFLGKA